MRSSTIARAAAWGPQRHRHESACVSLSHAGRAPCRSQAGPRPRGGPSDVLVGRGAVMRPVLTDRTDAGRQLAARLVGRFATPPVVLALPRGGVPVAAEIAHALHAPLDLLFVRKIGTPFEPELAYAAVVDGVPPQTVVNQDVAAFVHV